jgi:succinate-semialdehyde dehydrogenase/glutarate-semialdehyde dehydrogenase
MKSINPYSNKLIQGYNLMSDGAAVDIIDAAQKRFLEFKNTSFEKRAELMNKVADILLENKAKYAKLITDEMGKVYKESISEIEKCADVCRYYAQNAQKFLADEGVVIPGIKLYQSSSTPSRRNLESSSQHNTSSEMSPDFHRADAEKKKDDERHHFITYQPLGIVLAIMPWNFPFWQVFRFAAPTIMAGNVGLLKHASNVSGCALAIEEIFEQAASQLGFNKNVFSTLLINSSQVDKIIENENVKAVTLTGSVNAGKAVARKAGECLKKSVLELGGSDPYIIFADANLEKAAELCVKSRLINAGQSCIAAKRFIIVREVYDQFLEIFTQKMSEIKIGDPNEESTNIGPLANLKLRNELHEQVQKFIQSGAVCKLGGKITNQEIPFYPPTILTISKENNLLKTEELFGPVALVIKAENENDAIQIANNSIFGLGSAIFSKDISKATKIAKTQINSGACFINDFVKSNSHLPFGGINESGYGRELSYFGIREFVNVKTVSIQ